jgi:hypothetical protein
MNKTLQPGWYKKASLFLTALAIHGIHFAQDSTAAASGSAVTTEETAWFNETWLWVAGAAISVLVVVSLMKRAKAGTNN